MPLDLGRKNNNNSKLTERKANHKQFDEFLGQTNIWSDIRMQLENNLRNLIRAKK